MKVKQIRLLSVENLRLRNELCLMTIRAEDTERMLKDVTKLIDTSKLYNESQMSAINCLTTFIAEQENKKNKILHVHAMADFKIAVDLAHERKINNQLQLEYIELSHRISGLESSLANALELINVTRELKRIPNEFSGNWEQYVLFSNIELELQLERSKVESFKAENLRLRRELNTFQANENDKLKDSLITENL